MLQGQRLAIEGTTVVMSRAGGILGVIAAAEDPACSNFNGQMGH